jgi:flagellar basal body-associated protein FliL
VKRRLKVVVPLAAVAALGMYKFVLAKPVAPEHKVDGIVYVLPREFVVNLEAGRFAKLSVGLVLDHGASVAPEGEAEGKPPEGYGPMPQEALVRAIVTDTLTGLDSGALTNRERRAGVKRRLLSRISRLTDVPAHDVVFTDFAVQ